MHQDKLQLKRIITTSFEWLLRHLMIVMLIRIIVVVVSVISVIAAVLVTIVLTNRVPIVAAIIRMAESNIVVVTIAITWQQW